MKKQSETTTVPTETTTVPTVPTVPKKVRVKKEPTVATKIVEVPVKKVRVKKERTAEQIEADKARMAKVRESKKKATQ
jgi:hypothetical protein